MSKSRDWWPRALTTSSGGLASGRRPLGLATHIRHSSEGVEDGFGDFALTEFCEVLAHKNLGSEPLAGSPAAHVLVVRGPRLPHALGPHAGDLTVLIGVLGLQCPQDGD